MADGEKIMGLQMKEYILDGISADQRRYTALSISGQGLSRDRHEANLVQIDSPVAVKDLNGTME